MKNKVTPFPQPPQLHVPTEQPMILFTLGEQRFAIQWTVTTLRAEPAEVISIQKQPRDRGARTRRLASIE
jgi:hypothetical protein